MNNRAVRTMLAVALFVTFCAMPHGHTAMAGAQSTGDMSTKPVEPFGLGEPNGLGQYFIGNSYVNRLSKEGVGIVNVTFEPGCRNNWHKHNAIKGGGQILLCTAGRGWYQEWGKPARELKPGDVVNIPAGVKHWHGAARDSWFVHLAVQVPGENAGHEWLEPVTDEEYNKLP